MKARLWIAVALVACLYADAAASEARRGDFVLTARAVNAFGQPRQSYAQNEPVWLSVTLRYEGAERTDVWIAGDEYRGLKCWAESGSREKWQRVKQPMRGSVISERTTLNRGESIHVDIPLAEFVIAQGQGGAAVVCGIELQAARAPRRMSTSISTVVPIQFIRPWTASSMKRFVAECTDRFRRGDEGVRVRMLRCMRSVPGRDATALLVRGAKDRSEAVELAAIRTAMLRGESARSVTQVGAVSEWDRVRDLSVEREAPQMEH